MDKRAIKELIEEWNLPSEVGHDLEYAFDELLRRRVIREDEISMELVCGFFNVFARFCYCHNYNYPSYKHLAEKLNSDIKKIKFYAKHFHPASNPKVRMIFKEIKEKRAKSPHEKFLARRK